MEALPKGAISEIFGCVSSGKTLVLQELLAAASARSEFCAVVDSRGAFDPLSASRAGVDLRRLLWVRASHHIDRAFWEGFHIRSLFAYLLCERRL